MPVEIKLLDRDDAARLTRVAPGVFDHAIREDLCAEFLSDPRHHLAVALGDGVVVGFASAVHYVHPDKPAELWINEIGVARECRKQGLGTKLLQAILARGRELGCREAWVLAHRANASAMNLYKSAGGIEAPPEQAIFIFDLEESDD